MNEVKNQASEVLNIPPSMGDICETREEKMTYFSKAEVANMSPPQVKQHFKAIRSSMAKWR